AEAEAAQRRLALLGMAGTLLAASLDAEAILQGLASLLVPALADWCLVDLVEADGSIRRVAVAWADPAQESLARRLQLHTPAAPGVPPPTPAALRGGTAELVPAVSEDWLDAA